MEIRKNQNLNLFSKSLPNHISATHEFEYFEPIILMEINDPRICNSAISPARLNPFEKVERHIHQLFLFFTAFEIHFYQQASFDAKLLGN